jgi:hypothetical protein
MPGIPMPALNSTARFPDFRVGLYRSQMASVESQLIGGLN